MSQSLLVSLDYVNLFSVYSLLYPSCLQLCTVCLWVYIHVSCLSACLEFSPKLLQERWVSSGHCAPSSIIIISRTVFPCNIMDNRFLQVKVVDKTKLWAICGSILSTLLHEPIRLSPTSCWCCVWDIPHTCILIYQCTGSDQGGTAVHGVDTTTDTVTNSLVLTPWCQLTANGIHMCAALVHYASRNQK